MIDVRDRNEKWHSQMEKSIGGEKRLLFLSEMTSQTTKIEEKKCK